MLRPPVAVHWDKRTALIVFTTTLMMGIAANVVSGAVPDRAVARVYLLPAGQERTSIVLDLVDSPVGTPAVRTSDGMSLTIDISVPNGPVSSGTLRAASSSLVVRQVALSPGTGEQVVRVQVATRVPVKATLRQGGKRIYIDLTPIAE